MLLLGQYLLPRKFYNMHATLNCICDLLNDSSLFHTINTITVLMTSENEKLLLLIKVHLRWFCFQKPTMINLVLINIKNSSFSQYELLLVWRIQNVLLLNIKFNLNYVIIILTKHTKILWPSKELVTSARENTQTPTSPVKRFLFL